MEPYTEKSHAPRGAALRGAAPRGCVLKESKATSTLIPLCSLLVFLWACKKPVSVVRHTGEPQANASTLELNPAVAGQQAEGELSHAEKQLEKSPGDARAAQRVAEAGAVVDAIEAYNTARQEAEVSQDTSGDLDPSYLNCWNVVEKWSEGNGALASTACVVSYISSVGYHYNMRQLARGGDVLRFADGVRDSRAIRGLTKIMRTNFSESRIPIVARTSSSFDSVLMTVKAHMRRTWSQMASAKRILNREEVLKTIKESRDFLRGTATKLKKQKVPLPEAIVAKITDIPADSIAANKKRLKLLEGLFNSNLDKLRVIDKEYDELFEAAELLRRKAATSQVPGRKQQIIQELTALVKKKDDLLRNRAALQKTLQGIGSEAEVIVKELLDEGVEIGEIAKASPKGAAGVVTNEVSEYVQAVDDARRLQLTGSPSSKALPGSKNVDEVFDVSVALSGEAKKSYQMLVEEAKKSRNAIVKMTDEISSVSDLSDESLEFFQKTGEAFKGVDPKDIGKATSATDTILDATVAPAFQTAKFSKVAAGLTVLDVAFTGWEVVDAVQSGRNDKLASKLSFAGASYIGCGYVGAVTVGVGGVLCGLAVGAVEMGVDKYMDDRYHKRLLNRTSAELSVYAGCKVEMAKGKTTDGCKIVLSKRDAIEEQALRVQRATGGGVISDEQLQAILDGNAAESQAAANQVQQSATEKDEKGSFLDQAKAEPYSVVRYDCQSGAAYYLRRSDMESDIGVVQVKTDKNSSDTTPVETSQLCTESEVVKSEDKVHVNEISSGTYKGNIDDLTEDEKQIGTCKYTVTEEAWVGGVFSNCQKEAEDLPGEWTCQPKTRIATRMCFCVLNKVVVEKNRRKHFCDKPGMEFTPN